MVPARSASCVLLLAGSGTSRVAGPRINGRGVTRESPATRDGQVALASSIGVESGLTMEQGRGGRF